MHRPRRIAKRSVFVAIAAFAMGACVSVESVAPPVTPALVGASRGVSASTLEEGRRIFSGACTTCHTASPVGKYAASEWHGIVGRMAERTKLTPPREAALLAYLTAARATPPAP